MDLAAAWDAVRETLPARWRVGQPSISDPLRKTWSVTAVRPHPGRGTAPQTVTGTGPDEATALPDLDDAGLRTWRAGIIRMAPELEASLAPGPGGWELDREGRTEGIMPTPRHASPL